MHPHVEHSDGHEPAVRSRPDRCDGRAVELVVGHRGQLGESCAGDGAITLGQRRRGERGAESLGRGGAAVEARGSGAFLKLTVEALIAAFMYAQEFRISRLSVPGVMTVELGYWGSPATIFWFWLMMNAINLIDGMDGLAAGVTAIAATTILIIAYDSSRPFDVFFALIVIGLCVGFLPHNFHPARLFMGDAGSLTLGFLLASLSLSTSTKAPALLPILIPFLAVGMPVFDTAHAFFRRIFIGRHPFQADTKHLHHRLLALGLSQNRTVLFLYYISAYLGAMAYVLSKAPAHITPLVVAVLMVGLFLLAENLSSLDKKRDEKE